MVNFRIVGFIYCFKVVIVFPCLGYGDVIQGLDVDMGRAFPTIPIEWSGSYREDLTSTTLTSGHTEWAQGTPWSFLGTDRREGGPSNACSRGPGVPPGCLSAPSLFPGGPTGISPDDVGRYSHRCSSPLSTMDFVFPSNYMCMGVSPVYSAYSFNYFVLLGFMDCVHICVLDSFGLFCMFAFHAYRMFYACTVFYTLNCLDFLSI